MKEGRREWLVLMGQSQEPLLVVIFLCGLLYAKAPPLALPLALAPGGWAPPQQDENRGGRRGLGSSPCTCTFLPRRPQEPLPVFALHSHWLESGHVTTPSCQGSGPSRMRLDGLSPWEAGSLATGRERKGAACASALGGHPPAPQTHTHLHLPLSGQAVPKSMGGALR